jgi:hypothetical protein
LEIQNIVSEKLFQQMTELLKNDTFIIAIVPEEDYADFPECPHCRTDNPGVTLDQNMKLDRHIADLMLCSDCANVFIVACYPTLFETSEPVFIRFTLKQGENPIAEVVASDVAKQILSEAKIMEVMD